MAIPLSEIWLKAEGFRLAYRNDRTPHWDLALGVSIPSQYDNMCAEDVVIEVHPPMHCDTAHWMTFLCRDRNHHVCIGDSLCWEDVQSVIEALTRRPWSKGDVCHGSYLRPGQAAKLRGEAHEAEEKKACHESGVFGI